MRVRSPLPCPRSSTLIRVGSVWTNVCALDTVLHVVVLFDSSTSMQKQHIILKLSASSARCIQPRVPRAHGLRARLRVPLSLLSALMAHRVVSLLVRLCVTLLDSVSDLRCSRYGPESIFV